MDRRSLLVMAAALPSAAALGASAAPPPPTPALKPVGRGRVVIVGAGIIGCSIAYHLARRGVAVTLLDKGEPGMGTTQGAFATLLASHPEGPAPFNDLYARAVADWRRLELEETDAFRIQWGGMLRWAAPGDDAAAAQDEMAKVERWGLPVERLDAARCTALVPGLEPGAVAAGYFSPAHGTLDPLEATLTLLRLAKALGVEVRTGIAVGHVAPGSPVALATDHGPLEADLVVLAAGEHNPEIAATAGVKVPLTTVSGTLAHSAPMPPMLHRVVNGPAGSLKQNPDGRFVTGLDYKPNASGSDTSRAYGEQLLATAAAMYPPMKGARLEQMTFGRVPISPDHQPIVGPAANAPGIYVAAMMSGITMAALMGRLIATEIADGISIDLLAGYRPARFA